MKRYIFTLLIVCLSAIAMAENIITISSVSGISQTEVEVVVSLENTDAISALEMTIPLGDHLQYVDESAALSAIRSNGHQISAAQVAQDLRIYIYSMNLSSIKGNSGELLSFSLLLGDEPGDYLLTPNVIMSSAQGTTLDTHIQSGNVVILAPKLQILNEQIDFGHIPIRSIHTQTLELWNSGSMPLVISDIVVDDSLIIPQQTTLTIEPYSTAYVPLEYAPVNRGAISRTLTVISNDPNGKQQVTIVADPFSVNELHVGSASGIADSIVTIPLMMNNMETIVAMQCEFVLPEELEYVSNSFKVNPQRSNGHAVLSTVKPYVEKNEQDWFEEQKGDTLVLVVFSMSNKPFAGNDGALASFDLLLNGSSGTYGLTPINVILINISQENMVSATYGGSIDIQSPSFSGEDHINFSDRAITDIIKVEYRINNYGSAPLQIERATFLDEGYSIEESLPLTINPWEEKFITVVYQPSEEGDFSTTMNLYTNDPNNRLKAVSLYGYIYEPNALSIDGEIDNDSFTLSVSLNNYTDVVALQYDIHTWDGMTTSQSAFIPTERMQGHGYVVSNLGNNTYRVIIYSMSNQPIAGNEGLLHQLIFTSQENSFCDNTITLDNIILSNADGKDKVSQPSVSYSFGQTKYTEENITTCDQYTWNGEVYTESGTYTQTLQTIAGCDSIVILNLTINRSEREEFTISACESYEWHGQIYTENGIYEYRTSTNVTEKVYVGYNSQHDPIIGLTPPRGISRFIVDGFITQGNGSCFIGTGSPENGTVSDEGDLRIFVHDGNIYYDRMYGRNAYFEDFGNPFNIEFGNYYAKNVETGEYYFSEGENVYEYSNTEYPLTLFYNDYGKIHKVQFFDNNNLLWADINAVVENGVPMIKIDYYEADGTIYHSQQFTEHLSAETSQICERVEVLHLTINKSEREEYWATACDEYYWDRNGNTYYSSGDYEHYTTTEHGCERLEILHLTINRSEHDEYWETACDSYEWHGQVYTESGDYEYRTTTEHSCERVEVLHLTINRSEREEYWETACDEYWWHDNQYTESGDYEYHTTTDQGCERVEVLHLTINRSEREDYWETACDEYWWDHNGETYYESGDYEHYTTTDQGCERVEVLHLTINRSEREEYYETACDEYWWDHNGETYYESGDYEYYTTTDQGCERVEVLHLTINRSEREKYYETACDEYWWDHNGETYYESGDYEYYTTTDQGCERVEVLHLTINTTQYAEETVTACDNYTWNGETYTKSGDYTYTTTAANGCDSIVTLHLTINQTQYAEEIVTACDSYIWNGETYTASGKYTYTTTAANGCDSIVTLHLTINQTQYAEETVTACDSYIWNGETYTTSGDYVYTTVAFNVCDSIVTLHLTINQSEVGDTEYATICYGETYTWNGHTYAATGEYSVTLTNAAGCDSIATLHLTIMPEATTTIETVVIGNDELPYTWRSNTYLATGRYTDIEQYTQADCDSAIHVLDLTVLTTGNFNEESITICETETPYIWYGESYAATGKYTYTEKYAGTDIDSVQHILNLTVNPTKYAEETVTACDSYTWNGETYTTSGEYTYTTTAAANGCDSIVTLHLTINATKYAEETVTACDHYIWNGETYTTSGEYTYTTTAANGCDSVVTLHLTINRSITTEQTEVACDSYTWTDGKTYTESGTYYQYLQTIHGCDSTVVLHLTINRSIEVPYEVTTCDSYTWSNGVTYTQSGVYYDSLKTIYGCDSVEILTLTINYSDTAYFSATACDSYVWHDETYTTSGTYEYLTQTVNGCDSLEVLTLIVNRSITTEQTEVACDSYTWTDGKTYTESGTYYQYLQTIQGCDSTVVLHLTINRSIEVPYEVTACDSYTWSNGVTYTQSGVYYDSLKTIYGCDSVEILTLTMNYSDTAYFRATACDSYIWHDETYTTSGTYEYLTQTVHGCDSLEVLTLTINRSITTEETEVVCDNYTWTDGKTYTESGTYYQYLQTIHGCDSTMVLHLTVNRSIEVPYEVTACGSYIWSNGMTYTQSGVYYDSLKTIHGCDSVEILTLTINYSDTAYFSVTTCDSYVWHDETYTASGTYEYLTQTVHGCDSLEVLTLTINNTVHTEEYITACDSYTWNGQTYATTGAYTYTTNAANGCDSIVTLHLTILPDATTESETLALCPSELPYEWYGQSLTEAGTYSATEQYAGMDCDSVIHELTLNVYVQTLPATVTLPIVRMGEAIDVTIPTAEIQAHIAAETWYAPNALVAWYIMENSNWTTLTDEPVAVGIEEVTLKYAVETDCGIAESDKMVIAVETTGLENIPTDVMGVYKVLRDNKIFIIRGGKAYSIMGHLVGDKSVIESRECENRNEE